ncbi:MAG TPA: ATP-binding cassette domain-containing protein, partial [Gaiellales bacterium]
MSAATTTILDVEHLSVQLPTASGPITIVDDVSYQVEQGKVFGVAGESGSGKTISVLALMRLLPDGARIDGSASFGGRDLLALRRRALQDVRGAEIAMVFQDPLTSLHPMLSIGRQLTEHVRFHEGLKRKAADARAREL